jgi:hypothetical protein
MLGAQSLPDHKAELGLIFTLEVSCKWFDSIFNKNKQVSERIG